MIDLDKTMQALNNYLSSMTEDEKKAFLKEAGFVYKKAGQLPMTEVTGILALILMNIKILHKNERK